MIFLLFILSWFGCTYVRKTFQPKGSVLQKSFEKNNHKIGNQI